MKLLKNKITKNNFLRQEIGISKNSFLRQEMLILKICKRPGRKPSHEWSGLGALLATTKKTNDQWTMSRSCMIIV
jgi:hypothetical protein